MTEGLTAGIARILDFAGNTVGTGFVVTGAGLIATCVHVVWPANDRKPVAAGGLGSLNH